MRAGTYPFPEGKPYAGRPGGQVVSTITRANRALDERYASDDDS